MNSATLQNLYHAASEKTLAMWAKNAGIGEIKKESYYDPVKLALATGIQPAVPPAVSRLLDELKQLTGDDPLADTLPEQGLHFTFLPLTLPLYIEHAPLPEKIAELRALWSGFHAQNIVIRDLRLVALPGQLLLAGIPDTPATDLRHAFCEKVLNSRWKEELLMRHTGSALPAPFWHTTLLRYGAAYLPAPLRQFFLARQTLNYGKVEGELMLAEVNYNWTTCYPLQD